MKVLMTGFEPFGGASLNPSWEAVRRLPDVIGGAEITRLRLPVIYGTAGRMAAEAVRALGAEMVIATGVASGRTRLTPELAALNWRMASLPDGAGIRCDGEMIEPDAPAALMTRLPVLPLTRALNDAGIPAALSTSAGSYVCNDVYWHLLRQEEALGCRALFVHVPDTPQMDAQTAARGLMTCVLFLTAAPSDV